MEKEKLKEILENRLKNLKISNTKTHQINDESLANMAKHLGLNAELLPLAKEVLELAPRKKIIWLHLCECTGCTEAFLRSEHPSFDELIFDFFSLEYHETLMGADGWEAEERLENALNDDFILAVEGAVAAIDTFFFTIGGHGESGFELLKKCAKKASAIFAVGTCSSFGGIQAAKPNPTKTCGISEVLTQKIVNIPGCPPSDVNIIANFLYYSLFESFPELDAQNRPVWAYGKCLHDMCERKAQFESGNFAQHFGDEATKKGACLFKLGCKGPYTYNNCPKIKFNSKTSWPVAAGRGCMACSEKDFWDDFGVYEKPMNNTFSYTKIAQKENFKFLENKNLSLTDLKEQINDDEIVLCLQEQTQILYKKDGALQEFLEFEFESNLKLIFENIAKNKLGRSLVENFQKDFPHIADFIEKNFDTNPKPSKDIWKFFELHYILACGEFLYEKSKFLDLARNYKFKHASPYDFKLSFSQKGAKLDISKSLRFPLIYLCGGLEIEALAFSALKAFSKSMQNILKEFKDKKLILNIEENLNAKFQGFLE